MEFIDILTSTIWNLSADQIALISIIVTLLLFVMGKHSENKIKIYETRKEQYLKLIDLFQKIFSQEKDQLEKLSTDIETKKQFFDVGASIAIFGSKKLYKAFCFYRWLALDKTLQNNKFYSKDMTVYALGEMYQIMRKEVGLNNDFIPIDTSDILAFYINDFIKPEFKKKFYKYNFNKFCLKSAIFWGKIEEGIPLIWINNYIFKPSLFILFCIIRLPIKLLIVTPIKYIIRKCKNNS